MNLQKLKSIINSGLPDNVVKSQIINSLAKDENVIPIVVEQRSSGLLIAKTRGKEIQAWIDKHPELEKYLILDDDKDMLEHQMPNYIQTDSMDGMLSEHMMAARTFWKIEDYPKDEKKLHQHENMFAE